MPAATLTLLARTVAVCLVTCILAQTSSSAHTYQLSGHVLGSSGKNTVYVALWQADGFLNRPVEQVRIEPGREPVFQFKVPPGRWALSAFEDRNANGILDMGLFGPKEPSGFWRPFTGHHKPRFEEVSSVIDRDNPNADITLK